MGHREELLAAGRRLLERKGYAHITARDLVAESGTNLGSIAYHFGSKAQVLSAAIGEVLVEWTEELARVAMADASASPIQRAFVTWSEMVRTLPAKRSLSLSYMECLAQADRDPELREQFAEHYRRCRTRVAELVAESLGDDARPEDPKCAALASFVVAMCDGLAVQSLVDPNCLPADQDFAAGMVAMWSASLPADAAGPSGFPDGSRSGVSRRGGPDRGSSSPPRW